MDDVEKQSKNILSSKNSESVRILALDVGNKRIGVALSDSAGILAFPLTTIECSSKFEDYQSILALASENSVGTILIGIPLSLDGRHGQQAKQIEQFVNGLVLKSDIPVKTIDERYSTVEAKKLMGTSGAKPSRSRSKVDATAAAVILQAHLDSQKLSLI